MKLIDSKFISLDDGEEVIPTWSPDGEGSGDCVRTYFDPNYGAYKGKYTRIDCGSAYFQYFCKTPMVAINSPTPAVVRASIEIPPYQPLYFLVGDGKSDTVLYTDYYDWNSSTILSVNGGDERSGPGVIDFQWTPEKNATIVDPCLNYKKAVLGESITIAVLTLMIGGILYYIMTRNTKIPVLPSLQDVKTTAFAPQELTTSALQKGENSTNNNPLAAPEPHERNKCNDQPTNAADEALKRENAELKDALAAKNENEKSFEDLKKELSRLREAELRSAVQLIKAQVNISKAQASAGVSTKVDEMEGSTANTASLDKALEEIQLIWDMETSMVDEDGTEMANNSPADKLQRKNKIHQRLNERREIREKERKTVADLADSLDAKAKKIREEMAKHASSDSTEGGVHSHSDESVDNLLKESERKSRESMELLKASVAQKDDTIKSLQEGVMSSQKALQQAQGDLQSAKEETAKVETQLKSREMELTQLIGVIRKSNNDKEKQITLLQQKKTFLENEIKALNTVDASKVAELSKQLDAKQATINSLESELQSTRVVVSKMEEESQKRAAEASSEATKPSSVGASDNGLSALQESFSRLQEELNVSRAKLKESEDHVNELTQMITVMRKSRGKAAGK